MKIIVDAMGGDNAPLEIVRGALAANRNHGVEIILVGRTAEVLKAVEACGQKSLPAGVEIKDAKEVVEIADDPAMAFKQKPDSSLTVGLNLLKDGAGDAFVSAGSTGALLSGATLVVKRIRGIRRAAMGPQIPTARGRAVLCDCGANAECTPEYLLQFAYLGSYYAQRDMGIEKPRVGHLNIGAEEEKGDTLRHETYALLKEAGEAGRIHFIGNVEANEAMITERGSMVWMSPNMKMETGAGGIGKAFGRMFSGESMFQNTYTAQGGAGMIAFASSFPGSIRALDIGPGRELVVQKSGFLASEAGVQLAVFFQKKLCSGFFGGEGFIMQKFSGNGMLFLEVDGSMVAYDLAPGQSMMVDTGNLAAMEATCTIDVEMVKGVGNMLLGGEGLFNTKVTGPGRIWLQTLPLSGLAGALAKVMPSSK